MGKASRAPAWLEARDLSIGYRRSASEIVVAAQLTASLDAASFVCLVGPNGAGKSTLLRTLAGLQPALAGSILLQGEPLASIAPRHLARRLGVVWTGRAAPALMSAYELVALGRHPHTGWAGRLSPRDHQQVECALQRVGAAQLAARQVGELSDGELQKVVLARVLAQEASGLILDEVTAYLDLPRRVEIVRLLRDLAHNEGKAVLLSTHDLDLALRSADQMWLLDSSGQLSKGLPEELILNGTFEHAFACEGVDFDTASGSFHLAGSARGQIALDGSGLTATWTRRALERKGFEVVKTAERVVEIAADGHSWRLRQAGEVTELASLAQLLLAVSGQ